MGWEPVTLYEYGEDGRLVSSRPEPEWSDDERAKIVALSWWERTEKCPVCGGPKVECQAPENETRYMSELPVRCFYRTAVSRDVESWRADDRPHVEALIPQVRLPQP